MYNKRYTEKLHKSFRTIIKVINILIAIAIIRYMYIYHILNYNFMKYLYFQLVFILFPGGFIFNRLKLRIEGASKIAFIYGFGVVLTIIEYMIFYATGLQVALTILSPIISMIEIMFIIINTRKKGFNFQAVYNLFPAELLFILLSLYFVTMFGFTFANPMPNEIGTATYNQDLLWTVGNTEALMRSFPPMASRLSGVIFKYHYFLSVHMAVMNIITNLNPVLAFYKYSQIGKIFFLVFSVYSLGNIYFGSKSKSIFYTWIYFFTACASLKGALKNGYGQFLNINFTHLTNDPFGFEFGIAFLFLCSTLLIIQFREKKIKLSYLICVILLFITTLGSKGPVGLTLLLVLIAILFIFLIRKKEIKLIFIYTSCLTVGFLLVYYYLFYKVDSTSTSGMFLKPGYTVGGSEIKQWLDKIFGENYNENIQILGIPIHFFLFLPFASFPFIAWLITKIKTFSVTNGEQLLVGGLALSGISATYLFGHVGNSQLYFIMISIPFIEIAALDWIICNYKKSNIIFKTIIIITLILSSITSFYLCLYEVRTGRAMNRKLILESSKLGMPSLNSITNFEYDALTWLSNNTKNNVIIASNRLYIDEEYTSRYFYYSAFSQRQFFLEGWEYDLDTSSDIVKSKTLINNKLFDNTLNNRVEIMKANNINYLVVSNYINPNFKPNDNALDLIYENRDIRIYGIRSK